MEQNQNINEHVQLREVKIEDILPRDEIEVNMEKIGALLSGKKCSSRGRLEVSARRWCDRLLFTNLLK